MPMTITVLAVIEPDITAAAPLSKVMNERLRRLAAELQDQHLKNLKSIDSGCEDVVIYISYNTKYNIRWKIVNDVPSAIETEVAHQCALLGYILWKGSPIYNFKF
ncbi:hypothetical protein [Pedobacter sp.]|jgi:hypothetical protein|uniref:hypothetical protein n=1 Tax=Pedobacter sp. TaxID=1411316 RepID=UPI002CCDE40C|nr:hypothetical protein [Pedobacter sp.]HWW40658.1 hypothetical protein [Pedobacter sp.]